MKSLGRYELRERIGKGGMGEVYRALDPKLPRRRVAIKTLSSLAPNDLARFLREAEAISMASMSSRHIVKIFELGEVEGAPFIVMELLQGEDLERAIRRGPLEISRAVDIILGVCSGAWACHRRGILHRDIKPRNIFLHVEDEGEVVKILDFGVSTFPFAKEVTGPYQVMGTPRYMSPEQLAGTGIDERSDLYAIGVVLYECLTGSTPFEGRSDQSRVAKILAGRYQGPAERRPDIPAALDAIVRRAMSRDPDERFPTARDFGQSLIPYANQAKQILFTENFVAPVRPMVDPMSRAISGSDQSPGQSATGQVAAPGAPAQDGRRDQGVPVTSGKLSMGVVPVGPLVEGRTPPTRTTGRKDVDRTEPEEERSTVRYDAAPTVVVPPGAAERMLEEEPTSPRRRSSAGPAPKVASRAAEEPARYQVGGTRRLTPVAPVQEKLPQEPSAASMVNSRRTWIAGAAVLGLGVALTVAGLVRGGDSRLIVVPPVDSASVGPIADAGAADVEAVPPPEPESAAPQADVALRPSAPHWERRRRQHPPRRPDGGATRAEGGTAPILP
jgi:serine/threonine protein kinase